MEAVGSRCELDLYQGEGHGFFNFRNYWRYRETVLEMDRFLVEEGFFGGEATVD
jgi:acetyl esterase